MKTKYFFALILTLSALTKGYSQEKISKEQANKILSAYNRGIHRFMTYEQCGSPVDGPVYLYKQTENHFLDRVFQITPQQEADLGKRIYDESEGPKTVNNVRDLAKIRSIVGKLVAQSRLPNNQYHVYIIKSDEINAYSTIGGYIYVTSSLLDFVNSEDELAFVLGHELSHIVNGHLVRKQKKMAMILYAGQKMNMQRFSTVAINLNLSISAPFDQMDEYDADRSSVDLVKKAGYDQAAFNAFFQRLEKFERQDRLSRFTSTHPSSAHRRACLNKLIGKK